MMDEDLIGLLSAWRGGDINPDERDRLLSRLAANEAFRQAFVDEIRMLGMLKAVQSTEPRWLPLHEEVGWGNSGTGTEDVDEDLAMRRVLERARRESRRSALRRIAIVVVILAGASAAYWWIRLRRDAPVAADPPARVRLPDHLAVVMKLDGVLWSGTVGSDPLEGQPLSAGRLGLAAGRAILALYNGVILSIEGPADVDLLSVEKVFCRHGKLRARVPEGVSGFVVTSPGSAVVDLGTEFAVTVDHDGNSRLVVFQGGAKASLLDPRGLPERTQYVEQNRSFRLEPGQGRIVESPLHLDEFAAAPELEAPELQLGPTYRDAVLRSRPRGYWRCEALTDGRIPNEVPGGTPLGVNGPIELSAEGQRNRTAIFRPGAPQQFLTMEPLWELPAETGHAVELWFLSERIHRASLVGVYPPEDSVSAEFRFLHVLLLEILAFPNPSLDKPASVRFLRRWLHDNYVDNNLFSRNVYVPKRWHHVVAQRDGNRMDLYLDGVRDTSSIIERDPPNLRCRLVFGRRTADKNDPPKDSRPFVGRLDEIAIYDHPLSPDEVREHYGAGISRQPAD